MAVISDDFEHGVSTQLEFSEMDDATLARWLSVPEAVEEFLTRRYLQKEVGRSAMDNRFNKFHGKDGKFSSKTGGSVGIDPSAIQADLAHGRTVTVAPSQVDTLMRGFAGGPVLNLEHMQVSGAENANCFSKHAREIPRSQMPQLPEDVHALGAFNAKLAERGITARMEAVDPRSLTATQNELDASKVGKLYGAIMDGGWRSDAVLFTSKEGDVLDGHHRWAAASAAVMAGKALKVNVIQVDTDIDTLLDIAQTVSLPRKSLDAGLAPGRSIRSAFGEEPTTPPPSENEPWFWFAGKWHLVVTDTADGVPAELNFEHDHERSTVELHLETHYEAPRRLDDGAHYRATGTAEPALQVPEKSHLHNFFSRTHRDIVKHNKNCPECEANTNPRAVPLHPGCDCDVVTNDMDIGVAPQFAERWGKVIDGKPVHFVKHAAEHGAEEETFSEFLGESNEKVQKLKEKLHTEDDNVERFANQPEWTGAGFHPETMMVLTLEDARWSDIEHWLTEAEAYVDSGRFVISISVDNVRSFPEFEEWLREAHDPANEDEPLPGIEEGDVVVLSLVQLPPL